MGLATDLAKGRQVVEHGLASLLARRAVRKEVSRRGAVPDDHVEVVVYFPDLPANIYQVDQWFEPLRRLSERHPVAIVTRKWTSAQQLLARSPVPVHHAADIEAVERFLDRQRVRAILYVNQNQQNFPAMRFADPAHVFICHGESDKDYMSSNQLKAYDAVFVAGTAARERITRKLIGFDDSAIVEVGRPQVDVHQHGPVLPNDSRTVVLYAPTTEGDVPSMRYSSVAGHGVPLVRSLTESGRHRLIYRPHPRLGLTVPAYAAAHRSILGIIDAANRADPAAGHVADTSGSFGWQVDAADVCVADISAVAYDWLATAKPLVVTRPAETRAQLPESGLVRELALLDVRDAWRAAEIVDETAAHPDESHAVLVRRYFGDTTHGASMQRFLDACAAVVRDREAALTARATASATDPLTDPAT